MGSLSGARIGAVAVALLACTFVLASCGGGDDSESTTEAPAVLTADEVVAAFEETAGGYPFEKSTDLIEGAVGYGPHNSADVEEVAPLNDAMGDASILWRVFIIGGADPALDADAAKLVAGPSKTFEEIAPGVYLGDSNIAYVGRGNVVVTGPILEGDPEDPTLAGWKAALESL